MPTASRSTVHWRLDRTLLIVGCIIAMVAVSIGLDTGPVQAQRGADSLDAAVEACVKRASGFMPVRGRVGDHVEYVVGVDVDSAELRCTHRDSTWSFRVRATKARGSLDAAATIANSAAGFFWSDQSAKAIAALKRCAGKAPSDNWHWYETGGAVAISCGLANGLLVLRVHKADGVDAVLAKNFGNFRK